MTEPALQHTQLDGIKDYSAALDKLCGLAQRNLYFFEKNFDGMGFNSEVRFETLRNFLLSNPANRLYLLAHNTRYLSSQCARMTMLLTQFGHGVFIFQTPKNLLHLTEPFAVADESHYVRRFHFDDPRGIFAQDDPSNARALRSRYLEMWANSHPAVSATTLGL